MQSKALGTTGPLIDGWTGQLQATPTLLEEPMGKKTGKFQGWHGRGG